MSKEAVFESPADREIWTSHRFMKNSEKIDKIWKKSAEDDGGTVEFWNPEFQPVLPNYRLTLPRNRLLFPRILVEISRILQKISYWKEKIVKTTASHLLNLYMPLSESSRPPPPLLLAPWEPSSLRWATSPGSRPTMAVALAALQRATSFPV
jgi:hypothetical protein